MVAIHCYYCIELSNGQQPAAHEHESKRSKHKK